MNDTLKLHECELRSRVVTVPYPLSLTYSYVHRCFVVLLPIERESVIKNLCLSWFPSPFSQSPEPLSLPPLGGCPTSMCRISFMCLS